MSLRTRKPWLRAAFTLIELMIVVVIIGIIAAVAIPSLLSTVQQDEASEDETPAKEIAQAPPSAVVVDPTTGEEGQPAVIESSTIVVHLKAKEVLEGFSVKTHYDLNFSGQFTIRNPGETGLVRIVFPFPPGISEARNVSLRTAQGQDPPVENPDRVSYALGGITWQDTVESHGLVHAEVSYSARGREAVGYDVAGTGRSGKVRFEMNLEGAEHPVVPTNALQPTEQSDTRLVWEFEKLITNDAIRLELPAGSSPLGRIILLCQLAGLAVLLFGGGFWFLGEGYRPGMLDDFRWGHFLLLALNFALFFAVFAVVGYESSVGLALGASSVVSLPLLTLHTQRIVDLRFALSRNLPLALYALGVVVAGVYLAEYRPFVFLGAGVFLIAFVTVSYKGWATGRKAAFEAGERQRAREQRESEVRTVENRLQMSLKLSQKRSEAMRELLDRSSPELARHREAVSASLDVFEAAIEAVGAYERAELGGLEDAAHETRVTASRSALSELEQALFASEQVLVEKGEALEQEQVELEGRFRTAESRVEELTSRVTVLLSVCRRQVEPEDASDEATRLSEAIAGMAAVMEAPPKIGGKELELERMQLEAYGRELSRARRRLEAAQERHEQVGEQHRERSRREDAEAPVHCAACGSKRDPDSRFCPDCGTIRSLKIECRQCGTAAELPLHLMAEAWTAGALHCKCCGQTFAAEQLPESAAENDREKGIDL